MNNFTILLSILIGHINPQFFLLDMYTDYNAGVIEKIKAQRTSLGDLLFFSLFLEPALIAKSSLLLDVKPWDDETDMKKMEEEVRKITADGLLWGQGQWDMLYNSYIFGAEFWKSSFSLWSLKVIKNNIQCIVVFLIFLSINFHGFSENDSF